VAQGPRAQAAPLDQLDRALDCLAEGEYSWPSADRTVQKAADLAKTDCNRAMDLAHRLSSELRHIRPPPLPALARVPTRHQGNAERLGSLARESIAAIMTCRHREDCGP
jgi:hypothetical protein